MNIHQVAKHSDSPFVFLERLIRPKDRNLNYQKNWENFPSVGILIAEITN
jgi:hypothetical protein